MVRGGMDQNDVAQDTDRRRALVNVVMNIRVLWNAGNFLTNWNRLAPQEGLFSMKLAS